MEQPYFVIGLIALGSYVILRKGTISVINQEDRRDMGLTEQPTSKTNPTHQYKERTYHQPVMYDDAGASRRDVRAFRNSDHHVFEKGTTKLSVDVKDIKKMKGKQHYGRGWKNTNVSFFTEIPK